MKHLLTMYSISFPKTIVYMLQSTEYQPTAYLKWLWRTKDFSKVMSRRTLELTRAAKALLLIISLGIYFQIICGLALGVVGAYGQDVKHMIVGAIIALASPLIWSHVAAGLLIVGDVLITSPKNRRLIKESSVIFHKHQAIKIAIAGSYGKTTVKELLGGVLAEAKNVAITPANKNVASSHARFAAKLNGGEEVLVVEFGEGKPGDVARYTATIKPDIAVISGIAPAHLDSYPSLDAAAKDIFTLAEYVDSKNVYVNAESQLAEPYIKKGYNQYTVNGVGDWATKDVKVSIDGLSFTMQKGTEKLRLTSHLLGRHLVGPLAAVAAIAYSLGLTKQQIESGVAKTAAYEHRMQPRKLHGAWIIDDTYNGNIEGMEAGLALLAELPAKRKIYVTPGLVDQGLETEAVHLRLGQLIARAKPDLVVLMKNSMTHFIQKSLSDSDYHGDIQLVDDPLEYYSGVEHFIAAGDIILMQNDWTDNYS